MTILYCIFSLTPPGGMQRVLTVKANYFSEQAGHAVHIVTRSAPGEQPHFALSPLVRVHHTGSDYKKELSQLIFAIRPDIVISLYGDESRFLYKIGDGSKKILEFHFTKDHLVHLVKGLPHIRLRWLRLLYVKWLQWKDRRQARHYDSLVLLTERDRDLWGQPANAITIPNPLSFSSTEPADLQQKRIISAGRLIATKGFDLLIDAFKEIAGQYPDWKLTIFGEGQDRQFLLDRISHYGLQSRVEILPPVKDLSQEMRHSSIYAAASRYEGFGLVITEAMECGVPSVAFDCECGPREIIRNGFDGLLVEPLNTTKFAESLRSLIGSADLRITLGANARTSAKRFSPEKIMLRWEEHFRKLLNSNLSAHAR